MNNLGKSFIFCLTVMLFGAACKNAQNDNEKKLHDEVMAIHDEVMPKMGEMNRLKRSLKTYQDALPDEDSMKVKVLNAVLLLAHSEDRMKDWMSNYRYPNPEAKPEVMTAYLNGQKDTIKDIGNEIYMNIAIANGFLEKAPDSLKTKGGNQPDAKADDMNHDHSKHDGHKH